MLRNSLGCVCLLFASISLAAVSEMARNAACDIMVYFKYSRAVSQGLMPYRDFPVEYPPFSIVLFQLPRWVGAHSAPAYVFTFGLELLLFNALILAGVAWAVSESEGSGSVRARLRWYTCCLFATGPLVFFRYDLAAAAICFGSVLYWRAGRNSAGGVLAAVGTLTKFLPALTLLPVLARRGALKSKAKAAAGFSAALAAGFVLWFAWSPSGLAGTFAYHLRRGLQLESVYSGAILLASKLHHLSLSTDFKEGSYVLISPFSRVAGSVALAVQLGLILVAAWRCRRIGAGLFQSSAAVILAFILGSKVLSPQFLIWLIPFAAVMEGRSGQRCRRLLMLSCVLSAVLYPFCYLQLLHCEWLAVILLNARNLALIVMLFELLRQDESSPDFGAVTPAVLLAASDSGRRPVESRL